MNKRISAFLLSVVLCLAMACPAFAAVGTDPQITITVDGSDFIVKVTDINESVSTVDYTASYRYGKSGLWSTYGGGGPVQVSEGQCEFTIKNGVNTPDGTITETSGYYVRVRLINGNKVLAYKEWPEDEDIVAVTGVTIDPPNPLTLTVGDTKTLTATVSPENATNKNVTWTSGDETIAKVDADGNVTAVKAGKTTITVMTEDGNKTATCEVTVDDTGTNVPVESITLVPPSLILAVGSTEKVVANVTPANTTSTLEWKSSNPNVATVDANGNVTAIATGEAEITASADGQDATCKVIVNAPGTNVPVESISLSPTLTLTVGSTGTLTPTFSPTNATNKNVTWTSSNPSVATVENGQVKAIAVGIATITVTTEDGNKTAKCTVTVSAAGTNVPVTGVTLNQETLSLNVGGSETLVATVAPGNATNKNVTWKSDNPSVATVDETTGKVTAKAVGTATITATTVDGGKTASCAVTVTSTSTPVVPVTGVTLNRSTLPLNVGGTGTLSATVAPTNASNKGVTWKSSNENVASVDATGKVTAKAVGTATITVTTVDGGKTAACTVTVSDSGTTTYPGGSSTVARPGESGGNVASNVSVSAPASVTGGSVTISDPNAKQGSTVTLTVSPRTGYELDHITVKDSAGKEVSLTSRGNGVYAFTMPAGKVSVDYSFNKTSNKPDIVNGKATFDDVPAGAWYEEAVQYAYQHGIMNGIGDNKFSPDTNLTRAMIVQVLYNLEGKPTAPQGDFEDVPADKWYADPINWAASKGIVNGYGDGNFGPEDNITREQLAAILYRYAEFKKYDVSQKGDLSKFSDAASVSEWFTEAMEWAVGAGLIQGTNEGLLMPKSTATRAQVATVMQRFCEDVID